MLRFALVHDQSVNMLQAKAAAAKAKEEKKQRIREAEEKAKERARVKAAMKEKSQDPADRAPVGGEGGFQSFDVGEESNMPKLNVPTQYDRNLEPGGTLPAFAT